MTKKIPKGLKVKDPIKNSRGLIIGLFWNVEAILRRLGLLEAKYEKFLKKIESKKNVRPQSRPHGKDVKNPKRKVGLHTKPKAGNRRRSPRDKLRRKA